MRKYVSRSVIVALFVGIAWVSYFAYANTGIDCPAQSSCGPFSSCVLAGNNKQCQTTYTIENVAAGWVCTTGGTKTVCGDTPGGENYLCGKWYSCTFVPARINRCDRDAEPYLLSYAHPITCY